MGDLSDRREARRFVMTLPVRVLARDASGSELKAHTRDVSYRHRSAIRGWQRDRFHSDAAAADDHRR